ncbi:MAG: YbhB/YbcL family Raf kinase inhibitor-like protein [Acidimicrobiia bacterium]
MRVRRPVLLAVLAAVAALLSACSSSDGRELPPPRPGQTTTTSTSAPVLDSTPSSGVVEVFSLHSPAVSPGGSIEPAHTCDGEDLSPPLSWASVPPAAELALVVRDLDADGFVHWMVTGIDPLVQGLAEGGVPEGAIEHVNGFGEASWRGPCPPEGEVHTYEVALYALPEPIPLDQLSVPSREIVTQVEQTASGAAVLRFTYER